MLEKCLLRGAILKLSRCKGLGDGHENWHDLREILCPSHVCESKVKPKYEILVSDGGWGLDPRLQTIVCSTALVRVLSGRVKLTISEFRHIEMMISKVSTNVSYRLRVGEYSLCWGYILSNGVTLGQIMFILLPWTEY